MDERTGIPNGTPPAARPGGRPPVVGRPTAPPQGPPDQAAPPRTAPSQTAPTQTAPTQDVAALRLPSYVQPARPPSSDVPDWQALADRNERARRRGRLLRVGGVTAALVGVVALGAVAAAFAGGGSGQHGGGSSLHGLAPTATTGAGPGGGQSTGATGSASAGASASASGSAGASANASAGASAGASDRPSGSPSAPASRSGGTAPTSTPPLTPLQVISSVGTDTAPLSTTTLYTAAALDVDGQTFTLAATNTDNPCWKGTTGGLGNVLAPHGCLELLRATYVSGRNAVTVGIAVFDTAQQAAAVMPQYQGQIQSLVRGSVPSFCVGVSCPLTHATVGRYDYFTVAGTTDNRATSGDALAVDGGQALASYAYDRLMARG